MTSRHSERRTVASLPLPILSGILIGVFLGLSASTAGARTVQQGALTEGLHAYRSGRLQEAAGLLERAVQADPNSVDAYYHLAKIALIQSDPIAAFWPLKKALALDPKFTRGQRLMSRLSPQLLARVEDDLRQRRNLPVAYHILGFLLVRQGRVAEGIRRLEHAAALDDARPSLHDDLAWAHYKKRDFEAAYRHASRAYQLDPVNPTIARHYRQLLQFRYDLAHADGAGDRGEDDPLSDAQQGDPIEDLDPPHGAEVDLEARRSSRTHQSLAAVRYLTQTTPRVTEPDPIVVPTHHDAGSLDQLDAGGGASDDREIPGVESRAEVDPRIKARLKQEYLRARDLMKSKRLEEALAVFEAIAQIDPDYANVGALIRELTSRIQMIELHDKALQAKADEKWPLVLFTTEEIDVTTLRKDKAVSSLDNLIGEANFHLRHHEKAIQHLSRWLHRHPRDNELRYQLVKSLTALKKYDLALTQYQELTVYEPEALNRWPELKKLALRLWVKNYFTAIAIMALVWCLLTGGYITIKMRRGAGKRRARRLLGQLQKSVKRQKQDEILAVVEKLESARLTQAEWIHVRCIQGTALLDSGDSPKAKKIAQELYESYPNEPAVHHLRARVMLFRGEFSREAIDEYEKLLSVDPNNRALLEALNTYYQEEAPDTEQAVKILDRLLELDPTSPEYRYQRALRHIRARDFSSTARDAFSRALEVANHRADVHHAMAQSYFAGGRYLDAIKFSKQSVKEDMENPEYHRLLIQCYRKLEMIEEGRQEYKRMIEKNPDKGFLRDHLKTLDQPIDPSFDELKPEQLEVKSLYEKGVRLYLDGQYQDAIGPLTSVMNVEHLKLSAGALLVRSYLKLQEVKSALALFERLEVTRRGGDEFVLNLCYEMAEVYVREKRLDKAQELYAFICRSNVSFKDAFQKLERIQALRETT